MGIRTYRPTSAGRRNSSVNDCAEVTHPRKNRPEKSLLQPIKKTGGRNHSGKITSWWRGGGHKRMYRLIDFKRNKEGPGKVLEVQYDPNRNPFIALVEYQDGERRYILAPVGIKAGDVVESGERVEPKVGNSMPLRNIPVGMDIHNVELTPGRGGRLARSAGTVSRLMACEGGYATVTLPSGEMRRVHENCRATIGQLGNIEYQNITWGKAGRTRYLGRRPHVRGKAMNPVDHPMGGGEGRSNGGRHPCSPWGQLAKGGRTRNPRARSNKFIIRRRWSVRYGQVSLKRKK